MATTLQNLRDTFYDILREYEDVSAYPLTLVDLLLNASQQRICFWRVINPLTKEEARKGILPFLNTEQFYSSVGNTSTTAAMATTDVTISVTDASNFPSSWSLYVNGNIIAYTGTTATSFTGVTGILYARPLGTNVYPTYTVPSDYASVTNVIYNSRYKLDAEAYDDVYEMLKASKWSDYRRNSTRWPFSEPYLQKPFYAIKDNSDLILYNLNNTGYPILLRYEKVPTTMSASTDNATISNDIYAKTTIPYLAIGEMFYNRWEEARAADLLNFAIGQVREMYEYYNDSSYEKISWKQYRMAKSKINI